MDAKSIFRSRINVWRNSLFLLTLLNILALQARLTEQRKNCVLKSLTIDRKLDTFSM